MLKSLHRFMHSLAWIMAVVGGIVLLGLVLMISISIAGRTVTSILHSGWMQANLPGFADWMIATGIGPIFGDYEFLTAGLAFSVFAFIGWCQVTGGHATVDVFTARMPERASRILSMFIEVVFAWALILIAVQLYEGMNTQIRRGSTTFLLQYPVWWNYALALVPAAISAIIGTYMAFVRIAEVFANRTLVAAHGADH